ncbi:hypothetical protein GGH96_001041 [Coemansia sp. RSA 1972]|nr:hypothetical protein GGH96_001041 [Coemansia sp. RSA 1972]
MSDTIVQLFILVNGKYEKSDFSYDGPHDCDSLKFAVEAEYPGKVFSCIEKYQSSPPTYIVTEVESEFNEYESEQNTGQINRNDGAGDSGYESGGPDEPVEPVEPIRTLRREIRRIRRI